MKRYCPRCMTTDAAWRQVSDRGQPYIDGVGWADHFVHKCGQSVYAARVAVGV